MSFHDWLVEPRPKSAAVGWLARGDPHLLGLSPASAGLFFLRSLSFRRAPLAGLNVSAAHAQEHGLLSARPYRRKGANVIVSRQYRQSGWSRFIRPAYQRHGRRSVSNCSHLGLITGMFAKQHKGARRSMEGQHPAPEAAAPGEGTGGHAQR